MPRVRVVGFLHAPCIAGRPCIALMALARREAFEPSGPVRLIGGTALGFRARVAFPADINESRADDSVMRNGVDILHGSPGDGTARLPAATAAALGRLADIKGSLRGHKAVFPQPLRSRPPGPWSHPAAKAFRGPEVVVKPRP